MILATSLGLMPSRSRSRFPWGEREFGPVEIRPYFEGLLAEGQTRAALASQLGLAEEDWLGILVACGRECTGDVLIGDSARLPGESGDGYVPLDEGELREMFLSDAKTARENVTTRLSLAGTQSKTALAHMPGSPISAGWLRPIGLSASTHILKTSHLRDLPEVEHLCMSAAAFCGMTVAQTALLDAGNPVLAIERFDRRTQVVGGELVVDRLHQEDRRPESRVGQSMPSSRVGTFMPWRTCFGCAAPGPLATWRP